MVYYFCCNISGSDYVPSGGVRGSSGGARGAPKISVKSEKTDEETKEVLDMLLKDDVCFLFILIVIDSLNHSSFDGFI